MFNKVCASTATPSRLTGACHLLSGCHHSFPMKEKCVYNEGGDRKCSASAVSSCFFGGNSKEDNPKTWLNGIENGPYPQCSESSSLFSSPVKIKEPRAQRCSRDHLIQPEASRQIKLYFSFTGAVQVKRG